jgi:hypothetical protein
MALIEIDGLPIQNEWIFHGYVKEPDGNHKVIHFLKCFIIIIFNKWDQWDNGMT